MLNQLHSTNPRLKVKQIKTVLLLLGSFSLAFQSPTILVLSVFPLFSRLLVAKVFVRLMHQGLSTIYVLSPKGFRHVYIPDSRSLT